MANEVVNVAGTAGLLVTEGLMAALRRRGVLSEADIEHAFAVARAGAEGLPADAIGSEKVGLVIDALAVRTRLRA